MKIGVITLAFGKKFLNDIKYGRITLENYCKKHGYDLLEDISLLKEYKREVLRFYHGELTSYPPFPEHYFDEAVQQIFNDYQEHVKESKVSGAALDDFPEALVLEHIDNTWNDTAKAVFNNWLGKIYQLTHQDRRLPFMAGIDPNNPLLDSKALIAEIS